MRKLTILLACSFLGACITTEQGSHDISNKQRMSPPANTPSKSAPAITSQSNKTKLPAVTATPGEQPFAYVFAKIIDKNASSPLSEEERTKWKNGAHLHLDQNGKLGISWKKVPDQYDYSGQHEWKRHDDLLTIAFYHGKEYQFDLTQDRLPLIATIEEDNKTPLKMSLFPKTIKQK